MHHRPDPDSAAASRRPARGRRHRLRPAGPSAPPRDGRRRGCRGDGGIARPRRAPCGVAADIAGAAGDQNRLAHVCLHCPGVPIESRQSRRISSRAYPERGDTTNAAREQDVPGTPCGARPRSRRHRCLTTRRDCDLLPRGNDASGLRIPSAATHLRASGRLGCGRGMASPRRVRRAGIFPRPARSWTIARQERPCASR